MTRVGPYELGAPLGRGGMATVHRARAADGRLVALKLIHARGGARFEREKRLLASFTEAEGFVPLLDAGESPAGPWLVMPLLTGGTLRDRLTGPLPLDEALGIARAVARALVVAHARGIVHRDLKPENVLFGAGGVPLVADLGLAKHWDDEAPGASRSIGLSRTGEMRGTIGYAPPEQFTDAARAGPPADVFAFGAILHEMLTGEPAFPGASAVEVLDRMRSAPAPIRRRDVPEPLVALVQRALARDPERRFEDAHALLVALELAARQPPRRRALVLVAVAALALPVAATLAPRHAPPPPPPAPPPPPVRVPPPKAPPPTPLGEAVTPLWEPDPEQAAFARAVRHPLLIETRKHHVRLALVPPGRFVMGSPPTEAGRGDDEREHEVELTRGYYCGTAEVTNELYKRAFPEHVSGSYLGRSLDGPDLPVMTVAWVDAVRFCEWLSAEEKLPVRLPTEAEWERACRAGTRTARFWGDGERDAGTYANVADRRIKEAAVLGLQIWDTDDGHEATAPVGRYRPNAYGLHDAMGNAWEHVLDGYGPYPEGPVVDPAGDDASRVKVLRGGSGFDSPARVRSAARLAADPRRRVDGVGFRIVVPLDDMRTR